MPVENPRVEELFHTAQQLTDPAERQAWLEDACAGDVELMQRVESLLRADNNARSFLNLPAIAIAGDLRQAGTQGFDSGATSQTSDQGAGTPRQDVLTFLGPTTRPDSLGRLGHYEVFEVIGQGGFGTVLRAFDDKLHRVVALKVLAPELAANGSARKRFVREARTAAAVKNEHVVAIYEVDENAQPPYLAMEMIDGKSLQQKIDQQGPLSLREILRIGMQMAEGLAAAHKQGLVHRDIKPANILLENGVERVKLTDFGLARAVDDASVTQSGTVAGTPLYMSPEQAEGLAVDHRSDLFSLGTVLYAMCTGHSAFRASSTHAVLKRVIEAAPRPIQETNPDVPEWLCAIIAKLHAKNPNDRFSSAHEVAELLSQHLAHEQNPEQAQRPATIAWPDPKPNLPDISPMQAPANNSSVVAILLAIFALFVLVPLTLGAIGLASYALHHSRDIPASPEVVGVLSLELNNTVIEFRVDGDGPNLTAVSDMQIPLTPGEHWLWFKLDDIELKTDKFTIQPGQERELKITMAPSEATATFAGNPLGLQQLAGRAIAIRMGNGTIVLPGDAKAAFQQALHNHNGKRDENRNAEKYTPLFNGRNLTGWTRDPIKRGWQAEYGVLIGQGMTGFLVSEKEYDDFHLRARVKISRDGDGGIYFRCRPDPALPRGLEVGYEAQIIGPGTTPHRTGSLYRFSAGQTEDLKLVEQNTVEADRWFDYEIIAQQGTIKLLVDGKVITEHLEKQPLGKGRIALDLYQDRGRVEFQKLEIRELAAEKKWASLFNDTDLKGWRTLEGDESRWKVEDKSIVNTGKAQSHLFTERDDYQDFELRFEFKVTGDGDGGVLLRAPYEDGGAYELPAGYWIEIAPGKPVMFGWGTGGVGTRSQKTGWSILQESWHDTPKDTWTPMLISVRGHKVQTFVDGKHVATHLDHDRLYAKGCIALRHTGAAGGIAFRKLEIREFTAVAESSEKTALLELIAAAQRGRDAAQARFEAGTVTVLTVNSAEVELVEAKLRLADLEQDQADAVLLLKDLVSLWTEAKKLTQQRIDSGIEAVDAISAVEQKLAAAKARLAKAQAASK